MYKNALKKRLRLGGASCAIVLASFLIIRWPLYFLHQMQDFPVLTACLCLVCALTGSLLGARVFALGVSLSYPAGFAASLVFSSSGQDAGGGATSNGWIIWLLVIMAACFLTLLAELFLAQLRTLWDNLKQSAARRAAPKEHAADDTNTGAAKQDARAPAPAKTAPSDPTLPQKEENA